MRRTSFGNFLKSLRLKRAVTLREFSRRVNKDPSYISRIERGILMPPSDINVLESFTKVLKLRRNSEEMKKLMRLAAIDAGKIPKEALDDRKILRNLPVFFRTITGTKLEKQKLLKFLETLRTS